MICYVELLSRAATCYEINSDRNWRRIGIVNVVWDFVRMVCIDCHGVRWKTHSISWDGIKDVFIRNGEVHANIWDAPNSCFNAARVNLDNGSVIGGSCPPLIEHHPMT